MHYANGREAKAGDQIVNLGSGEAGILYNASATSTSCNGRIARVRGNDSYITIGECVHIEDVRESFRAKASPESVGPA